MLTKTSISAIRALTFLGLRPDRQPLSPRAMAQELDESPTYLAKVLGLLVKAGILQALRGVTGGVMIAGDPRQISLLAIVEACQGKILGSFCDGAGDLRKVCAFHRAAAELHQATVGVMSRWTLQDFLDAPRPDNTLGKQVHCWLDPKVRPDEGFRVRPALAKRMRPLSTAHRHTRTGR